MQINLKLNQIPIMHYTISNVIQKLLYPIKKIELQLIIEQLEDTKLTLFEIDDYVLSIEIKYDKKISSILNMVGKAICKSNKFELVVCREKKRQEYILCLDFIHHNLDFLIEEINADIKNKSIPIEVVKYLEDLKFKVPERTSEIDYTTYKDKFSFYIEALSQQTLYEADLLRDRVFNYMDKEDKIMLEMSLNPRTMKHKYLKNEIDTMQYWVARDKTTLEIIGITGLYTEIDDDKENCWLGWFGIDKRTRGLGYGNELLDFSIEMAKKMNKKYLHLYTFDSKEFIPAMELYDKYGFIKYDAENKQHQQDLFYKKELINE